MAPSFALLYVGFFEKEIIFNNDRNPYLPIINSWKRYTDTIFFWKATESLLKEFHGFINTNSHNLKFTIEYDDHRMNFLDNLAYRDSNRLGSNLYFEKPLTEIQCCMDIHSTPSPLREACLSLK